MKRDRAIVELHEQARKLPEQVKGSEQQNPYHWGYGVNLIYIACSFSYEDFGDKEIGVRRRRHLSDDLRDLKVNVQKFDGNPNSENYFDWVQA